MKRRTFYSFHYEPDNWRAAMVRNIGSIEGNEPVSDNDWETAKRGGDAAIRNWIAGQMKYRSCTVVLVGSRAANRKWINYEIDKSWKDGMGVVGIHIHGLKDSGGQTSPMGDNPFRYVTVGQASLASIVRCYNPSWYTSVERYDWISAHLSSAVEEAIRIRANN